MRDLRAGDVLHLSSSTQLLLLVEDPVVDPEHGQLTIRIFNLTMARREKLTTSPHYDVVGNFYSEVTVARD